MPSSHLTHGDPRLSRFDPLSRIICFDDFDQGLNGWTALVGNYEGSIDTMTHSYARHTQPMLSHINVGTGVDCTIRELAETIVKVTGFRGDLVFDGSKPDGTPRKLMDVSRLAALGWRASIGLEDGLRDAYAWFLAHGANARQ